MSAPMERALVSYIHGKRESQRHTLGHGSTLLAMNESPGWINPCMYVCT